MEDELVLTELETALGKMGLRPSAESLAVLMGLVEKLISRHLQSLGGDLLASHGPDSRTPDPHLASLGGYLLGHYS
jgi:hypothetical protein